VVYAALLAARDRPVARRELRETLRGIAAPHALLVATCQRTELYTVDSDPRADLPGARLLEGEDAVRHLYRVAAGLDSAALGEREVLGQLRDAHQAALEAGRLGPVLDRLARGALEAGRRARAETPLGSLGLSVAGVALDLAGPAARGRVAVLGTGSYAERVLDHLDRRALRLGRADLPRLREALFGVDLLVVATAAPEPVVRAEHVSGPLVVADLSSPPNADRALATLPSVRLITLEGVAARCRSNLAAREAGVPEAERLVEESVAGALDWLRRRSRLSGLAAWAEEVRERELAFALRSLQDLSPEQRAAVERLAGRLSAKLLAPTLRALAEAS
jgi:glutamyl-tRNA reductase